MNLPFADLAPFPLRNFRPDRYRGENERVPLALFAEADRLLLRQIYERLLQAFLELDPRTVDLSTRSANLHRQIRDGLWGTLIALFRQLGFTLTRPVPSPSARAGDLQRALHDLRGGAACALVYAVDLFALDPDRIEGIESLFFLIRDHLKIMRNCVAELDPERFEADASPLDQGAPLLAEKWSGAEVNTGQGPVRIEFTSAYHGILCASCLEFSTLDRVIYNLINNAARFSVDGTVRFTLLPLPAETPQDIRFVIANHLPPAQRAALTERFGGNLTALFGGGFTTGGHGLGARICADLCAQAYGVPSFEEAAAGGYFGARLVGEEFVAWFHWPVPGK